MPKSNDTEFTEFIWNSKPVYALVYLYRSEDHHIREISRAIDTTYSHGVRMMGRLEDHGLVTSEKKGRKRHYHLNDDGEELAELFEQAVKTCADIKGKDFEEFVQPDSTPVW